MNQPMHAINWFELPVSNFNKGTLVYLNAEPDLQLILDKVEAAGGRIPTEKTLVTPDADFGYWATILDTEGNRVALHSNK